MGTWEQEQARLVKVGEMFDADYEGAQMEVRHDDGLYRQVWFGNPRTSMHHFSLVTWPGHLTITGDVESFTFRRLPDMFEFFGGNRKRISVSYWAEKCIAGKERIKSYDQDYVRQLVLEYFTERVKGEGVPQGTGKALRWFLFEDLGFEDEAGAHRLLREFEHGELYLARCQKSRCREWTSREMRIDADRWAKVHEANNPGHTVGIVQHPAFKFDDTWEWDLTSWDHHFLYACHAIAWGIGRYLAHKRMPPRLAVKYGRT